MQAEREEKRHEESIFALRAARRAVLPAVRLCGKPPDHIEKPDAVILLEQPRRRYEAGEQVTIKTETLHDAGISASLNGQSVEKRGVRTENGYHLEFTFVMPEGDAVLRFEVTDGFLP